MTPEERLRRAAPLVAQHAEKVPFGDQLRGRAQFRHHLARDAMDAHFGPPRALPVAGIRGLAQQGDHAQLLEQHSVERDFVEPVHDLGRRPWRARALDGINLDEYRVLRLAIAHKRRDGRIAGVADFGFKMRLTIY